MASTVTYIPGCHCCICIQFGRHTAATATVHTYQACDEHAHLITPHGIADAIRRAKRQVGRSPV